MKAIQGPCDRPYPQRLDLFGQEMVDVRLLPHSASATFPSLNRCAIGAGRFNAGFADRATKSESCISRSALSSLPR
jgi:hypothetical protein